MLAGPDAGILECSIDGAPFAVSSRTDLFHRFSEGLHYPRTVVLAAGLREGPHEARLRLAERGGGGGGGNVARLLQFAVNDDDIVVG